MKFLLSLSFLLFSVATSINASSFFAEDPTPPPILDATGAPLQFGVTYHMIAAYPQWLGGISLGRESPFEPGSKMIQLAPHLTERGTPVVFSSAVQNVTGNITIGSELLISFYNPMRPNDESCGGSNSTCWVAARKGIVAVGGEARSNVFRLSLGEVPGSYLLQPVIPLERRDLVVVVEHDILFGKILVVNLPQEINQSFVFPEAIST